MTAGCRDKLAVEAVRTATVSSCRRHRVTGTGRRVAGGVGAVDWTDPIPAGRGSRRLRSRIYRLRRAFENAYGRGWNRILTHDQPPNGR